MDINDKIKIVLIKLKKMIKSDNSLIKKIENYVNLKKIDDKLFFDIILIFEENLDYKIIYENVWIVFEMINLFCRLNLNKINKNDLNNKLNYITNHFSNISIKMNNREELLPFFLLYLEVSKYNLDGINSFKYIFINIFESGKLNPDLKFIVYQSLKSNILDILLNQGNIEQKNEILNIILDNFIKNIKKISKNPKLKDTNIYNKLNLLLILIDKDCNGIKLNIIEKDKIFFIVIKLIFLHNDYNCLYIYSIIINFILKEGYFRKNIWYIFNEVFPFLYSSNFPYHITLEFISNIFSNFEFISRVILNYDILWNNNYLLNIIKDALIFINQCYEKLNNKEYYFKVVSIIFKNLLINEVKSYNINAEEYLSFKHSLNDIKSKFSYINSKYKKLTIDEDFKFIYKYIKEYDELDGSKITNLLGSDSEFSKKFREYYFSFVNMKNKDLLKSFKEFFYDYHMKGETQVLEKIFLEFSIKYENDNNNLIGNENVKILLYSLMMLNTDLNKINNPEKMSWKSFEKIILDIIPGFSKDLINNYYNSIKKNEIKNVAKISDKDYSFKIFISKNHDLSLLNYKLKFDINIVNKLRYDYLKENLSYKIFETLITFIEKKNSKELKTVYKNLINTKLEYDYFIDLIDNHLNKIEKDCCNSFKISQLLLFMIKFNFKIKSKIYIFKKVLKNLFWFFEVLLINIENKNLDKNKNLLVEMKKNYKNNNLANESFINKFSSYLSSNDDSFENKYFLTDLLNRFNKKNSDLNKFDMGFFNKLIKLLNNIDINNLFVDYINDNIEIIIKNKYYFILIYSLINESHILDFNILNNYYKIIYLLENKLIDNEKYRFCLNYLKIKNLIFNSSKLILEEDLYLIFESISKNNEENINQYFYYIFINYINIKEDFDIIEIKNVLELLKVFVNKKDKNYNLINNIFELILRKICKGEDLNDKIFQFFNYYNLILKKIDWKIDLVNEELLQSILSSMIIKINNDNKILINLFKWLSSFIFGLNSVEICYSFISFFKEKLFKIELKSMNLKEFKDLFEIIIKINKKLSLIDQKKYYFLGLEIYKHLITKYIILFKDQISNNIINNYINYLIIFWNKEIKYDNDIINTSKADLKNIISFLKNLNVLNLEEFLQIIKKELEYLEVDSKEFIN